ncbi:MAG: CvpA family protein [Firmicutes bacterium]|nr:CvpA family protein [Bacillota bacterium]
MNWLDYILVFIFLLNLYKGFRHGFLRQVWGLGSLLLVFYVALCWNDAVKLFLQKYFKLDSIISVLAPKGGGTMWLNGVILNIVAFLLMFLLLGILFAFIGRKLRFLNRLPLLGPLNVLTGGMLGAVRGLFIIFLIAALLSLLETDFWIKTVGASAVVSLANYYLPLFFGLVFDFVTGRLGRLV